MGEPMTTHDPEQHLSDWLKASNLDLWERMVGHRFCRDMAQDRLPDTAFVRYLRYEHAFVRAAISTFAFALAKAPTPADQDHLLGVLSGLAGEQQSYFQRTFTSLGLDTEVLPEVALPPAARRLRDGVLAIAAAGSFVEILAAMLAAEWMYLTWCEEAYGRRPQRRAPADWIRLHVEPPASAGRSHGCADALKTWVQLSPHRCASGCQANFGRVLELEIAFHDAPYDGE
jgi:thiaminase/transcriptional activator TenA